MKEVVQEAKSSAKKSQKSLEKTIALEIKKAKQILGMTMNRCMLKLTEH